MEDKYQSLLNQVEAEMQRQREQRQSKIQQTQPSEEFYSKYIIKEEGGDEIFNRDTCGFSDYEYEIAIKVLHAMNSDHQKRTILIQHPKFKQLRDELRDFKKGNMAMNINIRKEAKEEIARQKD